MSDTIIQVRELGKRYRLDRPAASQQTLVETIQHRSRQAARWIRGLGRRRERAEATRDFWALRGVSFDVKQGEVVGIIGRNGAGKSTLLKILSRITDPTEGRAIIHGRVASLLEVGTGFHPELTGRENIHLNGSILGMSRREIKAKFNQIVEFSGIEKFLDTPIKRYSSGMTVRLAFSVAAHLDPHVLVIDEVLAVGDAEFQKKCLGKMNEVARGGRTVLFVSHNLAAISSLCNRCVLMQRGAVAAIGATEQVVQKYQASLQRCASIPLVHVPDRRGNGALRFVDLRVIGAELRLNSDTRTKKAHGNGGLTSGRAAVFEIACRSCDGLPVRNVEIAVLVADGYGRVLFTCFTQYTGNTLESVPADARVSCQIDRLPLAPGSYRLHLWASVNGEEADYVESAGTFDVMEGDYYGTGQLPTPHKHGAMLVDHQWRQQTPMELAYAA